jgi:hypothetical protein
MRGYLAELLDSETVHHFLFENRPDVEAPVSKLVALRALPDRSTLS